MILKNIWHKNLSKVSDRLRNLALLDPAIFIWCAFIVFLFAIAVSLSLPKCELWVPVARSGSLITLLGVILTSRRAIRIGVTELFREQLLAQYPALKEYEDELDPDTHIPSTEKAKDRFARLRLEMIHDAKGTYKGILMIIIGTAIWGFADLLSIPYCKFF